MGNIEVRNVEELFQENYNLQYYITSEKTELSNILQNCKPMPTSQKKLKTEQQNVIH